MYVEAFNSGSDTGIRVSRDNDTGSTYRSKSSDNDEDANTLSPNERCQFSLIYLKSLRKSIAWKLLSEDMKYSACWMRQSFLVELERPS